MPQLHQAIRCESRGQRFEIQRCDDQGGGQNSGLVEFNVNGRLVVEGTSTNPVVFYPDTTVSCDTLGQYPEKGSWYGIFVNQNASCSLSNCNISYAEYGISSSNNASSEIHKSNLTNNSIAGIYWYKGQLTLKNSYIGENDIYGLYGYMSDGDIYGNRLNNNFQYGIKIYSRKTEYSFIQYDTLTTCATTAQNGYAISINGTDSVMVYKCLAKGYIQSGLYLNASNALVKNNDFSGNTNYSIFADNYSFPRIRQCRLDTTKTGVYSNNSKPDIGVDGTAGGMGNCSFLVCSKYYIYNNYNPVTVDSLKAVYNYYEPYPTPPYSSKFKWVYASSPIKWNPYLTNSPPAPRLEAETQIPLVFELRQNYPNPFNPSTTISIMLDEPAQTQITIYNILGQRVNTLLNEYRPAGEQAVIWNGKDESGRDVSSGVYFYVIQSGEHFQAKKMTLLR